MSTDHSGESASKGGDRALEEHRLTSKFIFKVFYKFNVDTKVVHIYGWPSFEVV